MSTKDLVLKSLRNAGGSFVSGETLSGDLHVSRTAIWKAIRALREEGYIIKAVTNRGYRLIEGGDTIAAGNIRDFLPSEYKSIDIEVYDILDSTNLKARQLSDDGASHGTVVIALQQTAGRGRLGRDFFSPREGLYLSIIIKPSFALDRAAAVTTAAAVAVAEAVEKVCGKQAGIKWVNDIFLNGKKVCGILTEAVSDVETGMIDSLVLGIGINVTTPPEAFPPEVRQIAGPVFEPGEKSIPKNELAANLLNEVLGHAEELGSHRHMEEYRKRCFILGKNVRFHKEEKDYTGVAKEICDDGSLLVALDQGGDIRLQSGEVSVRTD